MSDRTISLDDLAAEIDEHLQETDPAYVAQVAGRVLKGEYTALPDGETIRHPGGESSMASVIADIAGAVGDMEPSEAATLATGLLSDTYAANDDGAIEVTFIPSSPAP